MVRPTLAASERKQNTKIRIRPALKKRALELNINLSQLMEEALIAKINQIEKYMDKN